MGLREFNMGFDGQYPSPDEYSNFDWYAWWNGRAAAENGGAYGDPVAAEFVWWMLAMVFWPFTLVGIGIYALYKIPEEDYAAAWDWLKDAARAVRSGCSRTARAAGRLARLARERLGPPLRAAATAAREFLPKLRARMQPWLNSVARMKRQKAAQRRGRPLPPVERFKRRY